MRTTSSLLMVTVLSIFLFGGCSREEKKPEDMPPKAVSLKAYGLGNLNPNDRGESTPVTVRFYLLSDAEPFTRASVDELWMNERSALGNSLVAGPRLLTIHPNGEHTVAFPAAPIHNAATHVGALGLYRSADGTDQRKTVVPLADAEALWLRAQGRGVGWTETPPRSKP